LIAIKNKHQQYQRGCLQTQNLDIRNDNKQTLKYRKNGVFTSSWRDGYNTSSL